MSLLLKIPKIVNILCAILVSLCYYKINFKIGLPTRVRYFNICESSMATLSTRSLPERIFHACLFEFFAIVFTTLIGVYLLHQPITGMGIVAVLI